MREHSPVAKDDEQHPVPSIWRETIASIVDAFVAGDFELACRIPCVRPIDADAGARLSRNVADYGARLVALPPDAWNTSVCMWVGTHWDVFVDLSTAEEGHSDLVLPLQVFETEPGYEFKVEPIYVP